MNPVPPPKSGAPPTGSPDAADLIRRALAEDIGPGDATTLALVPAGAVAEARIVARGHGVAAGLDIAAAVFREADGRIAIEPRTRDGQAFRAGDALLDLSGPARGLLTAERTALNLLQRLCGIATLTRRFVEAARGVTILDTRKTTPGLRELEKYAVRCGGGTNHRFGLFDRLLIKDNHLAFWTGAAERTMAEAVRAARAAYPELPVEIEVDSEADLRDALHGRPDWVLLDNLSPELARRCIRIVAGQCLVELSGGITLDTVAAYAAARPDAISVGALTHSAVAADLALDFV